jgi:hypothetical protein
MTISQACYVYDRPLDPVPQGQPARETVELSLVPLRAIFLGSPNNKSHSTTATSSKTLSKELPWA